MKQLRTSRLSATCSSTCRWSHCDREVDLLFHRIPSYSTNRGCIMVHPCFWEQLKNWWATSYGKHAIIFTIFYHYLLPQKFRAEASLICRTEALSFVFASPKILISDCPSNRNGRDASKWPAWSPWRVLNSPEHPTWVRRCQVILPKGATMPWHRPPTLHRTHPFKAPACRKFCPVAKWLHHEGMCLISQTIPVSTRSLKRIYE